MIDWINSNHNHLSRIWGNLSTKTSTAITASVVIVLTVSSLRQLRRKRGTNKWPIVPGGLPFLGHALAFTDSDKFYAVLSEWAKDVGRSQGLYEFSMLGQRWIVLCNAETVMEAMRLRPYKLRRAQQLQNSIVSWMSGGVFDAEGHVWKQERRIVAPALNKSNVRDYFPSMKLVATRLVQKWEETEKKHQKGKKEAEVVASTDIPSSAMDVIALSMLGMDFDSLNHPEYPIAVASRKMFRVTFIRTLSPVPYWKIPFIGQNIDGGRFYSTMVLDAVRSLVRDCRKRIKETSNNRQEEGQEQERASRRTFLEKAVDVTDGEGSKLDEDRMVGNLVQLMLAGSDTSSDTTTFCLWELANNRELQANDFQNTGLSFMKFYV